MGQLVDQHDLGAAGQHRLDVQLGELGAAVGDEARRDEFDAVEQLGGPLAAVGFYDRGDDVGAPFDPAVRLAEHREGLSDARRRAQVDPQLTPLGAVRGRRRLGTHQPIIHLPAARPAQG